MADTTQRHPNLNLTAEEKRVFYQLFQAADTTNLGVITGEIAVPFFEKTHLPGGTLGEIWQIADKENRGLLTPSGFGIVLRLIGHAQAGRTPSDELALQPGPLPRFDGISVDTTPVAPEPSTASPPPGATGPIRVPPLQPDDVNKFVSLFEKSEVVNGIMSGDIAKQIFERARLPNEVLGRIWNLADTKQRGALDSTEFVIAMHLLTSSKSGALRGIPQTLPPGLYDAASRRGAARSSFGARPEVPPVPAIPKQFTGPQRTTSPMSPVNRPQFGGQISAQTTGGDWLITPQEKVHFDGIFETVDTARAGIISGDQAVAFFMKAQLPEEVLAQIWDLADIDADGQLTREEFAVAMYLVRLQRTGKDPIPQVLPPALIPPNMRRQAPAPAQVPAPAPPAPAPPAPLPRSAADDLFGLDSPPAPAPAQPQMPQSTGGSAGAWHTPASPSSRASPPPTSNTFKPFVPTSSFGQTLQPQVTGASSGAPSVVRSPPPPDDLLGDNDPEETNKLTQETTELANLSNQIGSLSKEMHNIQEKRTSAEQNITQTSQQKRDFEARLAQARTMYEQEVANFKALEDRLKASKAETAKLQQEYALIEGSREDLANQYTQISTALASDQQENASLKERIRQANGEVAQLKPALDKARSEARQQKGLVAINKKQLATVEGERDKIQGEIDDLSKETPEYTEDPTPVSSAAELASPAASTTSQNTNPFFRRTATGSSSERARSPEASNDQQKVFDSLFGQTIATPTSAGPPPTSFRSDSPQAFAKSPVASNVPTPSASPAPGSLPGAFPEPPPPTISRQMTPNNLPLAESQSVTSSTVVSPPASRFGGPDTSGIYTPSQATASEVGAASLADSSDYSREPTAAAGGTPMRSPFDEVPPATEFSATAAEPSTTAPTGAESAEQPKDMSFDELFGNKAHKRSESQKENDFDEAFASMKPADATGSVGGPATAAAATAGSEFPPIEEFHDDEDDSSDDDGPLGFDDNFTPVSPTGTKKEQRVDSIDAAQLAAFPTPGTVASSGQPPAAESEPAPPQYEASPNEGGSHVPPEFSDLLPDRADPTAAPDAPHSVETTTGAPVINNEPQLEQATPASAAKQTAPDFDAAFAGLNLAPAQEAEDDDDEPASQAKGQSDFDFSFDSPSQKQHEAASSTDAGHNNSSDFFSFDNNVHAATAQPTDSANGGASNSSDPDWDKIFAPLDNSKPAGDEKANGFDSKEPGWALDNDTGEDDLILQRLTGMGFPREDSLTALEKFDYNLDKAADYLTSKT
ncbi:hypothetical protein N7478_005861 [Penicillium angulare]|uniref:uncharacterized protein n=1 Tax=Penicillium angulare TaxID=116970 RepID=UPI0025409080|nr:uncharacterized protein N7478_005861 [Penicillium angulare]KAJ5280489.1 hypothetical protein N7478_005861 [Penicillium angulare]